MDALESRVKAVQTQSAEAQNRAARLEVQRENAEREKAAALAAMQEEFGVSSVEEGVAMRDKMRAGIEAAVAKVEKMLEEPNESTA